VRKDIASLQTRWREQGLSAVAGCLAFALRKQEVDAVIVGVNRCAELDEIIAAVKFAPNVAATVDSVPTIDAAFLDPSRWPKFAS
jgi:aryl-alcohol dehydrogenase-like predicted oxidoreductase